MKFYDVLLTVICFKLPIHVKYFKVDSSVNIESTILSVEYVLALKLLSSSNYFLLTFRTGTPETMPQCAHEYDTVHGDHRQTSLIFVIGTTS